MYYYSVLPCTWLPIPLASRDWPALSARLLRPLLLAELLACPELRLERLAQRQLSFERLS